MSSFHKIRQPKKRGGLRAFRKDESGSAAIEGVMGALLLIAWTLIAFQIYDAFRLRSEATRATYTIADMISRQRTPIGPKYVQGLQKVFNFLTRTNATNQSWLRVTLFKCKAEADDKPDVVCDGVNKKFTLVDSYATPGTNNIILAQPYTQAGLDGVANRIPMMAVGDMAVITESVYRFNPFIGIGNRSLVTTRTTRDGTKVTDTLWHKAGLATGLAFPSFVVTRPREPRLMWDPNS
jgi:Flp pilus assembly protein TadG